VKNQALIKKEAMQAVKYLLLIVALVFLNSCTSVKLSEDKSYSVERLNSADSTRSFISLNFYNYDDRTQPIPAVFHVNGIMFGPKNNLDNFVLNVRPHDFEINTGYIGKEWLRANVEVEKGDSVLVKFFLKDDPQPLVD
jgi:hypothetical protein